MLGVDGDRRRRPIAVAALVILGVLGGFQAERSSVTSLSSISASSYPSIIEP